MDNRNQTQNQTDQQHKNQGSNPTDINEKKLNQNQPGQEKSTRERENKSGGQGGMFDKQNQQGHNQGNVAPGTSTADEREERDSDNPGRRL
ncbi:MAG: hypothetical protein LCH30_11210 [Proteobacteria bacterium]|nr:hypothetical protein [Pseudomonadota bacterium]